MKSLAKFVLWTMLILVVSTIWCVNKCFNTVKNSTTQTTRRVDTKPVKNAYVTGGAVNVRSGPGTDFEVKGQLLRGDEVIWTKLDGEWHLVRTPDNDFGYIHEKLLTFSSKDLFLDIWKIASKNRTQLEAYLGPAKWGKIPEGDQGIFLGGTVEILMYKGKWEAITIYTRDILKFDQTKALDYLGLEQMAPDFKNRHTIRWERKAGLYEIAVAPDSDRRGMVEFLYIRVTK